MGKAGCLVALTRSLVPCSTWLGLEEAGVTGEDSKSWPHIPFLGLLSFTSSSV